MDVDRWCYFASGIVVYEVLLAIHRGHQHGEADVLVVDHRELCQEDSLDPFPPKHAQVWRLRVADVARGEQIVQEVIAHISANEGDFDSAALEVSDAT